MELIVKKKPDKPWGGLSALGDIVLTKENQQLLDAAMAAARGPAVWRNRKRIEAQELLALAQLAPYRLHVDMLDLTEALRTVVFLRTPVALRPKENGELPLADMAVLGITYEQVALSKPQPGYAFVQILQPHGEIWHPNVIRRPPPLGQPLCLGTQLPAGIRLRELVLMSYGALTMQAFKVEVMELNGVFHVEAARWWDQELRRLPLSSVPFLSNEDSQRKDDPHGSDHPANRQAIA